MRLRLPGLLDARSWPLSLRAFLLEQLRLLEAERKARCAKFGVKDL